jgi:uncharacterized protein involved in exopolysaccharide biosynthesis
MREDLNLYTRRADLIRRLGRRKMLIICTVILVVVTGMAATLLVTPKYEATMSLLVTRDRVDPQITSSDKNIDITHAAISDEEFNSELELLKSLEVITGVVKDLDLANNQKPKTDTWLDETRIRIKSSLTLQGWFSSGRSTSEPSSDFSIERTVNRVVANLDVVPTKKSRVIKVTYTDTDPLRAKQTLESLYKKYIELHVQLNEKAEAAQVFNEQTGKFNDKLDESTRNLKNFDSTNGISGADISTQQSLLMRQLSDSEALVNSTRVEIGEQDKRIASLQEKIAGEPKQIQTGYISKYVQAIDRMKEELVQLEQARTQLLQKYQPNSRFVRENLERIDQLKKSIAEETANPPQERSYAINDLRRKLEAELYEAQTRIASLKEREKTLTGQAARLKSQVADLNTKSIERNSLERQRTVNEEAYLLYQKKARENEIGQVLNKEQVMNFSLVDSPRTDGQQKNPKPILNLLVLLGVGLMAGIAAALVFERSSTFLDGDLIKTARQIELRYQLPVLASIPRMQLPATAWTSDGEGRRLPLQSSEESPGI